MAVKRTTRRRSFERLEPRIVLDATAGAGHDWLSSNPDDWGDPAGLDQGDAAGSAFLQPFSAEELEDFLVQDAVERYRPLFGQPAWPHRWWGPIAWDSANLARDDSATISAAPGYSTTNVQVAGVDEGDLIKTDGRYLYVAEPEGLTIVDVQTAESPRVVTRLSLEGRPSSLYLAGDRLVVISQDDRFEILPMLSVAAEIWPAPWQPDTRFQLTVFDVSMPSEAAVISRFDVEGRLVDSRLLGETVYVVSQSDFYLPPPESHCAVPEPGSGGDPENPITGTIYAPSPDRAVLPPAGVGPEGPSCVYESQAEYLARLEGQVLATVLPDYATFDANGEKLAAGPLVGGDAVYRPPGREHDQLLSVTAFDVSAAPALVDNAAVPAGWTSEMYMSHENVYVAVPTVLEDDGLRSGVGIFQFALHGTGGGIELAAQGLVAGWLPDSFALDEYEGHLRVVTQEGWGQSVSSHLYVLAAREGRLIAVGELANLAEGERLHSVRFLQEQAFLVTFGPIGGSWIDPLWAIDVSDPASPQVLGELEIPGFSDYLQSIEGDYLLGLGRDADIETGRWLAPQISLYDVSDGQDPQLADRLTFAESGSSWSEAFWDHHAISFYAEFGVLAIPMTTVESTPAEANDWQPYLWDERNELWVFQLDVTAGDGALSLLGRIEHDSVVRRSVRIGEMLYSVSDREIQVHPILDPAQRLARIPLGPRVMNDNFRADSDLAEQPLDVLANDLLGLDESARITSVGQPDRGGTVNIAADGRSLLYTPADGFFGVETFTYIVSDGHGGLDEAAVTIELREWNDGEVLAALAVEDLARRLQVSPAEIQVLAIEEHDWPDACLGIADDSLACAQVIVPGYRILLVAGDDVHVYHTDRDQRVRYAGLDVEDEPLVRIRLEAVDGDGRALDSIRSGESFVLNLYAEDLRHNPQGVYAAYVDVLYRDRLLRVDGEVSFAADYANGRNGETDSPGLIDELGAFAGFTPTGGGEHRIASVALVADRAGRAKLTLAEADEIGSQVLLYGSEAPVPNHRLSLAGTELTILPGWHNLDRPTDVNEDGVTTPEDALVVINDMNLAGIRRLETAAEIAGQTPAAVHYFLDVNRDRHLTPRDALIVINELNDRSSLAAANSADAEDMFADRGWTRFAEDPLVAWIDWPALADELRESGWQTALEALDLTAPEAVELAHQLLGAGAVRLGDFQLAEPWWSESEVEAVRQIWQEFRQRHGHALTVDQALAAIQQLGPLLEGLDLDALLPGLADKLGGPAPEIAIRDAILAQFDTPSSWLAVLGV